MADEKNAALVDSVSRLSARFDQLEQVVQELVPHRPNFGHSAASAACENDSAGRRQVVHEDAQPAQGALISSYSEL